MYDSFSSGQNESKETSHRQYYDMQMMKAVEGHSQLASKISGKEPRLKLKNAIASGIGALQCL